MSSKLQQLRENLQKAWENKGQIAEGFWNAYISQDKEIKEEIQRRLEICQTNECGYYDPKGEGEKIVMKGHPGCNACGCTLPAKAACMSCSCGLTAIGLPPKWEPFMTEEQEKEIQTINYRKQFEHRKKKQ